MKVAILTAGIGSRLNERTKYFNKALLRVGNKAAISHIIDIFSSETEFVIALGYQGDIVKEYLEIVHPDRKFIYVNVDKYHGSGAGPGYALLKCEKHLQEPFYFFACDTLVDLDSSFFNSDFEYDWVAYSKIDKEDCHKYCTIDLDSESKTLGWFDKVENGTDKAFVGLAFIYHHKDFWDLLTEDYLYGEDDELQVVDSIFLLDGYAFEVKWWDTGSEEGLQKARQDFKGIQNLDKLDEELYVYNKEVTKYFYNTDIVKNRVLRVQNSNSAFPQIVANNNHFYKYSFIEGKDLFHVEHPEKIMLSLLEFTKNNFWKGFSLDQYQEIIFKDVCKNFYYDKTLARIEKFQKKTFIQDKDVVINDMHVPALYGIVGMLNSINWQDINSGLPSTFHGDYNFSNIVLKPDNSFVFLDWRQDFGGLIDYGDRYYDFAKMYACLLMPHSSVKNNQYVIDTLDDGSVICSIERSEQIQECQKIFENWIIENNYDLFKVKILTAIVMLNMAPLHEKPLDKWLYYYSRYFCTFTELDF